MGALRHLDPHEHSRPIKRRPTAVRVVVPDHYRDRQPPPSLISRRTSERTPLIKAGVTPDLRKTVTDTGAPKTFRDEPRWDWIGWSS